MGFLWWQRAGPVLVTVLRVLTAVASPAVEPGSRHAGSVTAAPGLGAPWRAGAS